MDHGYKVFHPNARAVADFYVTVLGFRTDGEDGDDDDSVVARTR